MAEWIELHYHGNQIRIKKDSIVAIMQNFRAGTWIRFGGFDMDVDEPYEEVKKMLEDKAVEE